VNRPSERVKVAELVLDWEIYPRHGLDMTNVRKLVEARRAGMELPPVVVERASKRVVDGFHRVRAELKVGGAEALIGVTWKDYVDDAARFADAMLLNSRHGQGLSSYDRVRCLLLARQLGIPDGETAAHLQITVETAERLVLERTAIGPAAEMVPLKFTDAHLHGRTLTPEQIRGNVAASGKSLAYSAGQILNALENGLVDWSNAGMVVRLETLRQALTAALDALPQEVA
jgi:hypothetical protein